MIGYGIRIAQSLLSLVPPLFIADMACGVAAMAATSYVTGIQWDWHSKTPADSEQLIFHFTATIIEGSILNAILLILMLVIWGVQRLFFKVPVSSDPTKFCAGCGYDLRASAAACPECGEAIPQAAA